MKQITLHPPLHTFSSSLKITNGPEFRTIWDPIRRKWIILTPEEWVRQLFIQYLAALWPLSKMAVEKQISVYQKQKRFDLVLYEGDMQSYMLFEFKNPDVKVSNEVFQQAAQYNFTLRVPYLCISNGPETYCCHIDWDEKTYTFLDALPL